MSVLNRSESPRGFTILPISYRHDPDKGDAWARQRKPTYATVADWNREQEFDITVQQGVRAYPKYDDRLHLVEALEVNPHVPLDLMCDFNVAPMVWVVGQVMGGDMLHCLDEFSMSPADIDVMVNDVRTAYPEHRAAIHIYGDASGRARSHRNPGGATDYDRILAGLQGYPAPVVLHVPKLNPDVVSRLNAVNARLQDAQGVVHMQIARRCHYLIGDMVEVVRGPNQRDILKKTDPADPYQQRTHASDAVGYRIFWGWPDVAPDAGRPDARANRRPPRQYGYVAGVVR